MRLGSYVIFIDNAKWGTSQKTLNSIEGEGRGGINGEMYYSLRWESSILKDTLIF